MTKPKKSRGGIGAKPAAKTGRPRSEMTDAKIEAILKTIRLGLHPDRAAVAHGVASATMRAHKARHPGFATAVKEAEADAEKGYLSRILKHTNRQWTASAWILERRWPERWAKREAPPSDETVQQTAEKIQAALSSIAASVPQPPQPPTASASVPDVQPAGQPNP